MNTVGKFMDGWMVGWKYGLMDGWSKPPWCGSSLAVGQWEAGLGPWFGESSFPWTSAATFQSVSPKHNIALSISSGECVKSKNGNTGVMSMQISVYTVFCKKDVCKIMDMMCTVYAKNGDSSFNTSQTAHEAKDHEWYVGIMRGKCASFVKNIWFCSVVVQTLLVSILLKCVICFSTFCSLVKNFCTHYLQLVYSVCISSKASTSLAIPVVANGK